MSEDEVLAQLRDIHLPADPGAAAPIEFAAWPFIAMAVVVGAILVTRLWTRDRWRRSAITDFSRIVRVEDQAAQWSMLLAFAGGLSNRAGRPLTLPSLAYRHPGSITDAERAELISHLGAELRR